MRRPFAVLALALGLAACDGQAPETRPVADASAEHELGRRVYNFRCYFCHGYSGDARTVASSYLAPPPRDFTQADPAALGVERIAQALREGRPGTAMKSFAGVLSERERRAVSAFVHREFVTAKAANTRYHTAENGWPDHQRYRAAYPLATGEQAADTPYEKLDAERAAGKRLYLSACVTCHDRGGGADGAALWEARAVSYPPNAASCLGCHNREGVDANPDPGDPHSIHDRAPQFARLGPRERRGERLYQANCAFCHAADGTGRNWIGSFLEPHPANFTDTAFHARMTRARMRQAIREGVEGTSMPAWKTVLSAAEIDAVIAYVERAFLRPGARHEARP